MLIGAAGRDFSSPISPRVGAIAMYCLDRHGQVRPVLPTIEPDLQVNILGVFAVLAKFDRLDGRE